MTDFKAQLKKTSSALAAKEVAAAEQAIPPVDFKARLRKVSKEDSNNASASQGPPEPQLKPLKSEAVSKNKDSAKSPDEEEGAVEGKRKSTGSISSLRKMWESGDGKASVGGNQNSKT